ncbi:MAG: NepR family anti-sigma factor [Parvibaculum sp.]
MADEKHRPAGQKADGTSEKHNKVEQSARREALGTGLRRAYQKVLKEPIPDEFSQLLARLPKSDADESQ